MRNGMFLISAFSKLLNISYKFPTIIIKIIQEIFRSFESITRLEINFSNYSLKYHLSHILINKFVHITTHICELI